MRTWAHAKAHGASTLGSESRKPTVPGQAVPVAANGASTDAPTKPESEQPAETNGSADVEKPAKKQNFLVEFIFSLKHILLSSYVNVLLVFVPVGIAVNFAGLSPGIIFAMNAIAIIPLAGLLSQATEAVAIRLGDTIGALMNVTFGNAVELIIFMCVLSQPKPQLSLQLLTCR